MFRQRMYTYSLCRFSHPSWKAQCSGARKVWWTMYIRSFVHAQCLVHTAHVLMPYTCMYLENSRTYNTAARRRAAFRQVRTHAQCTPHMCWYDILVPRTALVPTTRRGSSTHAPHVSTIWQLNAVSKHGPAHWRAGYRCDQVCYQYIKKESYQHRTFCRVVQMNDSHMYDPSLLPPALLPVRVTDPRNICSGRCTRYIGYKIWTRWKEFIQF